MISDEDQVIKRLKEDPSDIVLETWSGRLKKTIFFTRAEVETMTYDEVDWWVFSGKTLRTFQAAGITWLDDEDAEKMKADWQSNLQSRKP